MASSNEVEFELEKLLGEGGFGAVYLGTWKQNGSAVKAAIKCVKSKDAAIKVPEENFQKEMDILVQLNHLFTVRFLGCTSIESTWYIAMELCVGTLNQYVNNQLEDIPKGSADDKYLAGQIVIGLTYLHDKRIVHKDLKPDNILMWRSLSGLVLAKLADFGFSRQLPLDKLDFEDTTHLGTSGYIAPELCGKSNAVPTFESDVWALGVVLFFIFSDGQHPHGDRMLKTEDTDVRDMLIKKLKTPPNVSNIERQNWDAADLVLHLIDADPTNRPNIRNVFIHPYFSLSNEGTKKQFLLIVHNTFRGVGYKSLTEFYSQSSIQNWFEQLDPHLKRKDIEEDLAIVQRFLKTLAKNPLAPQLETIVDTISHSPLGQQKKQVIDNEKNMIADLDTLKTYNARLEILRQLLDAGPRLIATYTWSQLKSNECHTDEPVDFSMDEVIYSMSFLPAATFEELIEMKLQRLEEHEKQFHLNDWFHLACMLDLPAIAATLLCSGAEVNSRKPGGWTALHAAVMNKQSVQLVESLLEIGADPSIATEDGITALHMAALSNDNPRVVQLILNACKQMDRNCCNWPTRYPGIGPRQLATLNPNPAIQNLFIESGCIAQPMTELLNPFRMAVLTRNAERIRYLIGNGADVNAIESDGSTALHWICPMDDTKQLVEMLLQAGADPNIQDVGGKTALHCAVLGANTEIANLLLDNPYKKANPDLKMKADERTCLHIVTTGQAMRLDDFFSILDNSTYQQAIATVAGQNWNLQTFEEMVRLPFLGQAINGTAPPHTFANKHVEMIVLLATAGADLHSRDKDGNTPLHCAAANSPDVETTRTLLELGANPNAVDNEGYTPLECAAHQNLCPEVTQELWFATFDGTTSREKMQAVADLAAENENPEVLQFVCTLMGLD